ncbi:Cas1p domain containing protein [Hyaloscypha variabilis]
MVRPKTKSLSAYEHAAIAIERVLQSILAIIALGVVYRYCWIDISDPYKCGALLNKGEWLDPGPRRSFRNPFQLWQPPGCLLHEYKKDDIQGCFGQQRLVFIGDSTIRQIFWAVAKKMDQERAEEDMAEMLDSDQKHKDLEFTSAGVTVHFIWDPWLNSTGLDVELESFQADPRQDGGGEAAKSASLILLGAPGLWNARHGQENYFKDFRESIDRVIPYMDHAPIGSGLSHRLSRPFPVRQTSPNLLLLAPVQVPRYQSLTPSREATITPEKIDVMNDLLQQVSAHSYADVVWSYSLMTFSGRGEYEDSGLHVVENVAHRKADVLLNLRCNSNAASKGYPFDRTCCSNYTYMASVQWLILLGGMFVLPWLLFVRRKRTTYSIGRFLPNQETMSALAVFGLVVCFCFYADRTQIFEKSQKLFQQRQFLLAWYAVLALGLVFLRRSQPPVSRKFPSITPYDHGFLSRDQSDEWKGWMQFFILIYHYTNASKTLWIYEIVRLLVASYLFLTGYGHTLYFLKNNDYSLRRIATVLIRLNLLGCVLPYMMRTDYLFYYFAPLVSFWFFVIYFTLKTGHQDNTNTHFMVKKILLSAIITTAFTKIPGILEFIALILKYSCAISWNITEWRFRLFLDMYIVYVGMLVAVLSNRSSQLKSGTFTAKTMVDRILEVTIEYKKLFKTVIVLLSLGLLPGFWTLTRRSPDKQDYNWWMPFISFIPILSLVTLRNSHRLLRNCHFGVFAWLGRFSLETYVLQYHIWLAGDTKGLLRLGLWSPCVETALLTVVFIWLSWLMAGATQSITNWIVGKKPGIQGYDDEDDTVGPKYSPYLLPKMEDGEGTPSKDVKFNIGQSYTSRWVEKWVMRLSIDLRWRLGLILLVMWVANVTYR